MSEIFTIPAGNYNVTEDQIDNWVVQSSICTIYPTTDGQNPSGDAIFNVTGNNLENFDIQPWQLAICEFVNNNPVGYFTGGGRVNLNATSPTHNADISIPYAGEIIDKVTHGFQLHCDSNSGPNNLEVNWLGFQFHLEQLENALCYDDGTINEPPAQTEGDPNSRKPTLDVYYGEGYGRYDGQCGAYAKWVMDDNGEPGKIDQIVSMVIWDKDGDLVLNINPDQLGIKDTSISGNWTSNQNIPDDGEEWLDLEIGNHQWTPHPFKSHGPTNTNPCAPIDQAFNATGIFEDPLG